MTNKQVTRHEAWRMFLNENFCSEQSISGNRPCDNGIICDKCSDGWVSGAFESYYKNLIRANVGA